MKKILAQLLILIPLLATIGCVSPNQEVITVKLRDSLIAVANEARAAGASSVEYETYVTDGVSGSASVVVPTVLPLSFGASRNQEVGTKVTVHIDTKAVAQKTPSNQKYLLNLNTMESTAIPL